ncbi:HAD-IB family phosphatase [Oceanivirga salmonicida]|uniref:HAD-IB family phosphatase n=1 Tax=Oceanivirga salmonicida TaxID=1769291 RepID=UPI0008336E0C|nr:HAD family hydrolase [Oceanivirga salmonicida]
MFNKKISNKLKEIIKEKNGKNYIVLDCDNTILMNDIQFATTHYILKNMLFTISIDELRNKLLPRFSSQKREIEKFINLYSKTFNKELTSLEVLEFQANYEYMIRMLYIEYKVDITFIMLSNKDISEILEITKRAISYHKGLNFDIEEFKYNNNKSNFKTGLSISMEMKSLIKSMYENNIDIYVVSASATIIVEEVLKPISKYITKIYGMTLEIENDKFTGFFDSNAIQPMGKEKVKTIDKYIYPLYNKGPLIVAGDSMGDEAMLTNYKDTKLSLLIDRNRTDDFKKLIDKENDRYMVQRVDEYQGIFIEGDKSLTI